MDAEERADLREELEDLDRRNKWFLIEPPDMLALLDQIDAADEKLTQIQAATWEQGYEAGRDDENYYERGVGHEPDHPHRNPYRADAQG